MRKAFLSVGFATAIMLGAACAQPEPTPITCATIDHPHHAQVVDDETGSPIRGAYWLSETLDGEIFLELEEGGDHVSYLLVLDVSIIGRRATAAAMAASVDIDKRDGSGSEDFRIVVAKEGYVTIVRQLKANANVCYVGNVEGDVKFRLVKGPPGEDDAFRKGR